jgi:cysteinyl-tRNA synthetase
MVKYWLHNGLLRKGEAGKIGGKSDRASPPGEVAAADDASSKLSRSQGAGGLADLIARHGADRIRFLLLRTHYRSTVIYGEDSLADAAKNLETFYRYFDRFQEIARQRFYNLPSRQRRDEAFPEPDGEPLLESIGRARESFLSKMDDDFNTGGAIADLFDILRELNKYCDQQGLERLKAVNESSQVYRDRRVGILVQGTRVLRELTSILGLFRAPAATRGGSGDSHTPKLMELMIALRKEAREKKDFATADRIRTGLSEIGITLEDRKDGTLWRADS